MKMIAENGIQKITMKELQAMSDSDAFAIPMDMVEEFKQFENLPRGAYMFNLLMKVDDVTFGEVTQRALIANLTVAKVIELQDPAEMSEDLNGKVVDMNYTKASLPSFVSNWKHPIEQLNLQKSDPNQVAVALNGKTIKGIITWQAAKDKTTKEPKINSEGHQIFYSQLKDVEIVG